MDLHILKRKGKEKEPIIVGVESWNTLHKREFVSQGASWLVFYGVDVESRVELVDLGYIKLKQISLLGSSSRRTVLGLFLRVHESRQETCASCQGDVAAGEQAAVDRDARGVVDPHERVLHRHLEEERSFVNKSVSETKKRRKKTSPKQRRYPCSSDPTPKRRPQLETHQAEYCKSPRKRRRRPGPFPRKICWFARCTVSPMTKLRASNSDEPTSEQPSCAQYPQSPQTSNTPSHPPLQQQHYPSSSCLYSA